MAHIQDRSKANRDLILAATYIGGLDGGFIAYANQVLDDNKQNYLASYKQNDTLKSMLNDGRPYKDFYVDEYPKLWEHYTDSKVTSLGTVYKVAGNKTLDEILALNLSDDTLKGNVYNVSGLPSGQATGTIPAGKSPNNTAQTDVRIGDQILVNQDGKLDNLRGFIDLSAYQTKTIPSWNSSVSGLPTTVETALTWLYTTNRYKAGTGIKFEDSTSGAKSWTINLQTATASTLGGVKAKSKPSTGSFSAVYVDSDGNLSVGYVEGNTDNTKIVVGSSSVSKSSSTGVTFKGVDNTSINIKNDVVEVGSKMSVRVDGQTESTTITPKTLVLGGKNGVSVKYGGTANDLITIENSGVRSVTQNGNTLTVDTNGTTKTLTFTDTTYSDYSGSSHGLVPPKTNDTASADYFLNEKGKWTQVSSIPTLDKRKIVVGGNDGKITTDFSGEIWSENNLPVNNGTNHPYKGNLITLGNDGKIRRAVLNTSNNISKLYSSGNDLYLSGPEFEGSFNTPSDFHRHEKISEYINVQTVAQDGNTPAHNKYIFNIYNNTLTHLATGGNYTYMTSNQSISWRLRDGLGSLYNWEHNTEKYTGDSELTRRFHHAWQNGMYAAYNVLDESAESNTIRRNTFQSNISHGMLIVPPLSADTCAKYPLSTDSKPSETANQGFLIDKYGLHKTEGTGGQILTIEPTKAIRSSIDAVSPKLLFATRCMPTDVSLVLGTGDTGKIHFGDLTQIEMKSDSKGTYLYPLNNCSVEWSNPRCNNTVLLYMVIKPSYFWSSLGRFTYNIASFELYGQISNVNPNFNYTSTSVYGNVSLSEAPVEFVTNYEDLPFINTTFNTPVWRNNTPWSDTVFTYQYAKHISGDTYSWEDEGKVHIGSSDWKEDKAKSTSNKTVKYYSEMYIWDDKDGGEHIPTNRANIDPTIKGDSYFAEVIKYETATTTTDSQGKPVVTTTYSFDISVRKWNYNSSKWTGPEESKNVSSNKDYSNIDTAATPLIKKLNSNVMPTLKARVQFLEGYEQYGICKKLDVYDGATGKVIDVQDDQKTSYLNSETKIATLPTFKLIAWNEDATQDTYMIFGKKLNS